MRIFRPILATFALMVSSALIGQRLPIKSFSASDGLPGGGINRIVRDSHGFLWFCSAEGAARFDGHTLVHFGTETGLPSQVIHDLVQTRDGCFWFATGKGLCRLDPTTRPEDLVPGRIKVLPPLPGFSVPNRLLEDKDGVLWCGTTSGLFRVHRSIGGDSLQFVDLGLPRKLYDDPVVSALAEKEGGGLWIGTGSGLYGLDPDGRVIHLAEAEGLPNRLVRALARESDGTLWVGSSKGIATFRWPPGASRPLGLKHFSAANGMHDSDVQVLLCSPSGNVLAGTAGGLTVFDHGTIRNHGPEQGLKAPVFVLEENTNGDLWLGHDSGVQRWVRDGLTTFTARDGLAESRVDALFEDQGGALVAGRATGGAYWLDRALGRRFLKIRLSLGSNTPGWGWNQTLLQDHLGAWWLATGQGLACFDRSPNAMDLAGKQHVRIHKVLQATGADGVFALFEDSRGDIWFSVASPITNGLGRWLRSQDRVEGFREKDGLPRLFDSLPTAFAEDRVGNVWVAFNGAGVARYRNGRFDFFTHADGVPEGWIRSMMKDATGRIWLASSLGGAGIIEAPEADRPSFRHFTVAQGLASNSVWTMVEDRWGRMYVGTGAGIDRVDLKHERVSHLSEAQGLATGLPRVSYRDREGALWFGLSGGLSRYLPIPPNPDPSPPIYITGLRVAGTPRAIPESGITDWELPTLTHHQNRIQVDFTSPEGLAGQALLYQYRLEGVSEDWTPPSSMRDVDLANLAPGRYHFQVRAVGAEGKPSDLPAELRFIILPPVWMRGWFVLLVTGGLGALAWLGYRARLRQLLEVERIRTRIAADLHDDIGASLSRIAILSEVVKRRTPEDQPETTRFLTEIAESSRDLVDSMAEIVWSINPKRDDLQHLLARIGQFASATLQAKDIRWTMSLPPDPAKVKLTPEQRRGMYLILKEAINNALKHSGCRSMNLHVALGNGLVTAQIRDDGSGLPPEPPGRESTESRRGRGLINMQVRAHDIGGRLDIISGPEGTTIRLDLPFRGGSMNMPSPPGPRPPNMELHHLQAQDE